MIVTDIILSPDMQLCHHKTKHWYFKVFFPLLLVVQIALLVAAYVLWVKP